MSSRRLIPCILLAALTAAAAALPQGRRLLEVARFRSGGSPLAQAIASAETSSLSTESNFSIASTEASTSRGTRGAASKLPWWSPVNSAQLCDTIPKGCGGLTRASSAFAVRPSLLDIVLDRSRGCLVVVVPAYNWKNEAANLWSYGQFRPSRLEASIAGGPNLGPGSVSRCRTPTTMRAPICVDKVVTVTWCNSALHGPAHDDNGVTVSFKYRALRGEPLTTRVHVAPPPPLPSTGGDATLAACTLFSQPQRLLLWAQYMVDIGVDVIYAYYNGNKPTDAEVAASPAFTALRRLSQQGRLVLHEWPADYYFYSRNHVPSAKSASPTRSTNGYGVSQNGAMLSCIARYKGRHQWTAFLDDDEYPFVLGGRTLKELLASKSGERSLLLDSFWAKIESPAAAPLTLDNLSAAVIRKAPSADLTRTKHIDARHSSAAWTVHAHADCKRDKGRARCPNDKRCCLEPYEGGILHFTNHTPLDGRQTTHVSAGPGHWRSRKVWPQTAVLRQTLQLAAQRRG